MKIKVVKVEENKDGSANVVVEYDKEFEKAAVTSFIMEALKQGIKNARSKKKNRST